MPVKAKFYVGKIDARDGATGATVHLGAVCRGIENSSWAAATPSGSIQMTILNDLATEYFEQGAEYEVTFVKAAKPMPGDGHQVDPVKAKHGYTICGTCGAYPLVHVGAGEKIDDPSTWGPDAWKAHDEMFGTRPVA